MADGGKDYVTELRKIRAILITSRLKDKFDIVALEIIQKYEKKLDWSNRSEIGIDEEAWDYVKKTLDADPKLVFCHPDVLIQDPRTSLYYRGLSSLSLKAVRDYAGGVDSLEEGARKRPLTTEQARRIASAYNPFISSIVSGVDDWTLEDGHRAVIATIGITLDGVMRNKIGTVAENRVRKMIVEWASENGIIESPAITDEILTREQLPKHYQLAGNVEMEFGSEPDVSFYQIDEGKKKLVCVLEIKGGTDPAGALERYGAATKSFQSSLEENKHCQNFLLSAVYTEELTRRISDDRLVHKYYDIIKLIEDKDEREKLFKEVFHFTLRIT
jgi:hypothetical protein